jgi:hypothetical protein
VFCFIALTLVLAVALGREFRMVELRLRGSSMMRLDRNL